MITASIEVSLILLLIFRESGKCGKFLIKGYDRIVIVAMFNIAGYIFLDSASIKRVRNIPNSRNKKVGYKKRINELNESISMELESTSLSPVNNPIRKKKFNII